MNNSKKGISMISLVIIIVVTIILLSVAITAGYRYVELGRKAKAQALSLTIGNAALRRQNDLSSGVAERFYEGYVFDLEPSVLYDGENINKYSLIEGLPDEFPSGDADIDGIPDVLQSPDAMWYMVDAESAASLGAPGAEELLTRNISYNSATGDTKVNIVLADYISGKAFYVTMPATIAEKSVNMAGGTCPSPASFDGNHKFTVVTCTEPSKCIYCGYVVKEALGHSFVESTCTTDGYCKRCNFINPDDLAKGHLFITNIDIASDPDLIEKINNRGDMLLPNTDDSSKAWVANANRHWHECLRCGLKVELEEHIIDGYINITDTHHQQGCSKCGWSSIEAEHNFGDPISVTEDTHKIVCIACLKELVHDELSTSNPHTGISTTWFADSESAHYRVCKDRDACNKLKILVDDGSQKDVAIKEAHIDSDKDYYCDKCGRGVDRNPPKDFNDEDYGTYARFKSSTTNSITVEAYTIDEELGVDYYQFGIYDSVAKTIAWIEDKVYPSAPNSPVENTFTDLENSKDYVFYVRAYDKEGNVNNPAMITGRTKDFPEFAGLINMPTHVVKGPVEVGIKEVKTDLTDVYLQYRQSYRQDNGEWSSNSEWSSNINISNIPTTKLTLTHEDEKLEFRFIDSRGNTSSVVTYTTNYLDNTPPEVTIASKTGDTPSESAAQHFATVTIADTKGLEARAGIAPNTLIRYAWSTSNTEAPTFDKETTTKNTSTASSTSLDIETPPNVKGTYYLWIQSGIVDAVGNATTSNKCSEFSFNVDDIQAELTEITMLNVTPDSKVPNEHLFVKTNGEVTVTFKADKALKQNPIVRINDVNMNVTSEGLNYTCKLIIDSSFAEGTLQLYIGDVVSQNGRRSNKTYSNADIVTGQGPVYYDKTLPVLEYVPKNT